MVAMEKNYNIHINAFNNSIINRINVSLSKFCVSRLP